MTLVSDYAFTFPNLRPDADGAAYSTPIKIDRALSIPGWMRVSEVVWLALQATGHKRIIELGSYCGRSTRALADNTAGRVLAIDRFPDDVFQQFQFNMDDLYGVRLQYARVDHADIDVLVAKVVLGGPPDMVFIDGDHAYTSVIRDIKMWLPVMAPDCLLCGHDVDFPEVRQAAKDLFNGSLKQVPGTSIWYVAREPHV